jgi:hypothetical protein
MDGERSRGSKERKPVSFRCLLDEQPADLLPVWALDKLNRLRGSRGLMLNPCCQFDSDDLRRLPFLDRFHFAEETLWSLDPGTNALLPFGLSARFRSFLGDTRPGETAPRDVPAHVAAVLQFAGLLVDRGYKSRRQREWSKEITERSAFFRKHGYVTLRNLLHPFHLASLRQYYRELTKAGEFKPDEAQGSKRVWMHNEPMSRFFHHQLTTVISDLAGEPVQPSFAFVWCYRGRSELPKHLDREQCEFTVSLCVDFTPEPQGSTRWPIYVETEQGLVTIQQALGEGLLFRGRDLPHYRNSLPPGCTSTSVLFHFVPRGFTGPFD